MSILVAQFRCTQLRFLKYTIPFSRGRSHTQRNAEKKTEEREKPSNEQNWIRTKASFSQNLTKASKFKYTHLELLKEDPNNETEEGEMPVNQRKLLRIYRTMNTYPGLFVAWAISVVFSYAVDPVSAIVAFGLFNYQTFKQSEQKFRRVQLSAGTYFDKTTGTTSLTLYNNVLYGIFTLGDVTQKFPKGDPLDVPINYLHLPPKIGDNVFLSTNLAEMKEKCPKAFNSGLLMDKLYFGMFTDKPIALQIEKNLASKEMRVVYIGFPGKMTLPDGEEKEDFLLGIGVREKDIDEFLSDPVFAKTDIAKRITSA